MPDADALEEALVAAVGRAHVLVDPGLTAPYETDWTRRFSGRSRAVVRPRDTGEVAAVLRACAAAGQPVVPEGGNTGLVGGSVPRGGEVVLSTRRLDRVEPVEPVSGTLVAGAGVTLRALQDHAAAAGLQVGTDHAARDSATVHARRAVSREDRPALGGEGRQRGRPGGPSRPRRPRADSGRPALLEVISFQAELGVTPGEHRQILQVLGPVGGELHGHRVVEADHGHLGVLHLDDDPSGS